MFNLHVRHRLTCYRLFYNEENELLEFIEGWPSLKPKRGWNTSLAIEGERLEYKGCTGLYFLGDGPTWYTDSVTGQKELRYGNE
jgi:hypothetical protein